MARAVRRNLLTTVDRDAALAELRRHAIRCSPWYRERLEGLDSAPLDELPVLTKDDLIDHFDLVVTDPALTLSGIDEHLRIAEPGSRHRGYWIGVSSGGSGRPGVIVLDEREWADRIADAARAVRLSGPSPVGNRRLRHAKVGGPSGWHLSAQVGATLADPRRPTLRLPATTPFGELVDRLTEWQPTVLTAYATILAHLAEAQLTGDLDISPTRVHAGAELLTGAARDRVRLAWGVEPFDQYVTTEAGFVAAECDAHDGMHLLDDRLVVEVVDAGGRPVAEGDLGDHLLVTVLSSRTLPLIRYRLEDRVRVHATAPCACGRTSSRVVLEGRSRDLVRLPGGTEVHPVVFSQVMDRHRVARWQVIVRPDRPVELLVAGADEAVDRDRIGDDVAAALRRHAETHRVEVTVTFVDQLPRGPSGKAERVIVTSGPAPGAAAGPPGRR